MRRWQMRVMPPMTSENLRTMNPEEAIIVSGSLKPIKVQLTPFYKSFWLKLKTEQKPPVFNNMDIPEQVPLLPLD
ncbi:MAG: hypothetical protein IPK03_03415 [Bacteroidetes bacterium]|nr:hypothetical protein [Bacteroidota bacterium]